MSEMAIPQFTDVLKARHIIRKYLPPTPLHNYPALDQLLGARVFVKHENYQPIGAFKVRGGINLVSQLSAQEKEAGVATASTGNHGQSIAYAARIFGVRAAIYVPENSNPIKVEAIRSHGAEIVVHGKDFDEAKEYCQIMAKERRMRFISSGDEPHLIAGVGTHTLEIMEELPDVDMIFVPVGGGSGASGACLAAKTMNPSVEVIAVQAKAAPAAYLTWKNRKATESKMETMAEGLACRVPFMLPQQILWKFLDDFVLLEEDEMKNAVRIYLEKAKTLSEPAGAAPLAAALKLRDRVKGKTIALILSGGNISPDLLRTILQGTSIQT
ncbi:MAG TPA: threonine/serine dehydratase [Acidobacteriota bacterium]|nr:threonine/serine dehydratase [Acidobacteriota bacterium]